jgi:hypothetical protein
VNLLNRANEKLGSKGLKFERSVIIWKVIPPVKDLYFKNLTELLGSFLKKTHDIQGQKLPPECFIPTFKNPQSPGSPLNHFTYFILPNSLFLLN